MKAIAIGKFDALHRGHLALAERAVRLGRPHLLTFAGMAEVLGWPRRQPLVAPADRARVLAEWSQRLGAEIGLIELPFAAIQPLSPAEFVRHLVREVGAQAVVVGDDFRFGRGRSGATADLVALARAEGCAAEVVPAVLHAGTPVSSSGVRDALAAGDVALAAALLGRPYRLCGTVVRGDGRGRRIGVPTANLGGRSNQEPASGVYAGWALLDGARLPAAINVGHVPTVGGGRPLTVETHLLGYDGDCYGRPLALEFTSRLRDERRFAGLDELVAQIRADIAATRDLLAG